MTRSGIERGLPVGDRAEFSSSELIQVTFGTELGAILLQQLGSIQREQLARALEEETEETVTIEVTGSTELLHGLRQKVSGKSHIVFVDPCIEEDGQRTFWPRKPR